MKAIELAGGVIRNGTGELLLLHRNQPHLSQWELPGGKVEVNESPEEAARRELHEELGIEVTIQSKIGQKVFRQLDIEWLYHWFEVRIDNNGECVVQEPDIFDEMRYWDIPELTATQRHISPNVLNLLRLLG